MSAIKDINPPSKNWLDEPPENHRLVYHYEYWSNSGHYTVERANEYNNVSMLITHEEAKKALEKGFKFLD